MIERLTEAMERRPLEVPQVVADHLAEQAVILEDGGIKPHREKGREVFGFGGEAIASDGFTDESDRERRKLEDDGYTNRIEIRRDPDTGDVVYAAVNGYHPRSVTRKTGLGIFIADKWEARIHLPTTIPEDGHRRLVLDSWTVPLSQLGRIDANNPKGLSGEALEEYTRLYARMFEKRNEHGQPRGSINRKHRVYPDVKPNSPESKRPHESLPGLLEKIDERVERQIGYIAWISADTEPLRA